MSFEPITLELQYEERDLLRVVPFIQRKVSGVRWYVLPFFAFFCVTFGALLTIYRVAIMGTYSSIVTGPDKIPHLVMVKETLFHAVAGPMSLIILGLVYTALVIRRTPTTVRKMMANNPVLRNPFTLIISEDGIQNFTNGAETKYQWSFIKSVYEKLGGFIIVFQPNTFHFIPAHKISEEKYLLLKKILTEKVGISEE
jgi:hypothetical protein